MSSCGGQQGNYGGVCALPLGYINLVRRVNSLRKISSFGRAGEGLSTRTSVTIPSTLFPEPHSPDYSHKILHASNYPPYVGSLGKWLQYMFFNRAPIFLEESHLFLIYRTCTDLHYQMLCRWLLSALLFLDGESAWVWNPTFIRGDLQLRYTFRFSATSCSCGASPPHVSILHTSLPVAS